MKFFGLNFQENWSLAATNIWNARKKVELEYFKLNFWKKLII